MQGFGNFISAKFKLYQFQRKYFKKLMRLLGELSCPYLGHVVLKTKLTYCRKSFVLKTAIDSFRLNM